LPDDGIGWTSDDVYDLESEEDEADQAEAPEWSLPKTTLEEGVTTELLVAHGIEHRLTRTGAERIVMFCSPKAPPSQNIGKQKGSPRFRWL
jgi:hypothetical protein